MQSDVVREYAGIPDDESIMICIALGYPDQTFPANAVRSERADNADFVRYVGF
jgi:nitroreductase